MPKLLVKATELQGTNVERVSMVNKAANRLPFRLTKSEDEEMFDLAKVGRFLKADKKPGVLAAVVSKSADLEAVKASLTAAGLSVAKQEEKDGLIVFSQDGVDDYDTGMLKVSDELGLVISGLTKSFESYDFNSTSFGEVFKTGSFYPSIRTAQEMLNDTIHNIMYEAKSPTDATNMIQKSVDEFQQYVTTLTGSLPVHAFKAEQEICKADKKGGKFVDGKWVADEKKEPAKKEEISSSPTHGNEKNASNDGTKNNNVEGDPAHGNETPHASGGKQSMSTVKGTKDNNIEGNSAVKAEEEGKEDPMAAILAAVQKSIADGIASVETKVSEQVSALKADVKAVSETVTAVKAQVAKAEEAINGTVSAEPSGEQTRTTKADRGSGAPPLLDTGYMSVDAA